ncbi:MAG: Wzt carbohydrate-binding domain-containing protein, partial [Syntrophales bacterium LBB04]|nr:Wzt carbohydrate-binding domain-containing protein [Syntrophales bacterium LBB04]
FQKKCLGKMQDVSQAGRTILFVSHNMSAITKLCGRAILLDQGRMVRKGDVAEVVSYYLDSALGAAGTAEWKDPSQSPGSNGFKLASVSITDTADVPLSVVNVEQPLKVKIGYRLDEPNLKFRCMAIFNTHGIIAFATNEPLEIIHERTGLYYSTVQIPANLLAEGEYLVSISVFASRGKKLHYCKAHNVVAFQVYDPVTGNSARGDYAEGLDGVTRPKLPWQTAYAS